MTAPPTPTSRRPFLTAQWRDLGLITYDVDPTDLTPYLPPQCQPDLLDGRAFVSLVMFDFHDTRVLGMRWPGYGNFPEINLRYYVRHAGRRGVGFIRELVPSRLVAWVARTIYNEPYVAVPMHSQVRRNQDTVTATHRFRVAGRWHVASVHGRVPTCCPGDDSVECFFKEHQWGFGRSRRGALRVYEVRHPIWRVYSDATADIQVDFAAVYGKKWGLLNGRRPHSVLFAVGSQVAVYPHADHA